MLINSFSERRVIAGIGSWFISWIKLRQIYFLFLLKEQESSNLNQDCRVLFLPLPLSGRYVVLFIAVNLSLFTSTSL